MRYFKKYFKYVVDELFIGLSEIRVRPLTVASVGTLLDSLELAFH